MDKENALIDIITNSNIRFQGILLKVDRNTKTISLKNVRNFGTEDRKSESKIEATDEVIPNIIFNSKEIKDLKVLNNNQNPAENDNKTNENDTDKNENNGDKSKDENYNFDDFFDNISTTINNKDIVRRNYNEQLRGAKETFGNYDVNSHVKRGKRPNNYNKNYSNNYSNNNNNSNNYSNKKNTNNKYYFVKKRKNFNDNFYYVKKDNNLS